MSSYCVFYLILFVRSRQKLLAKIMGEEEEYDVPRSIPGTSTNNLTMGSYPESSDLRSVHDLSSEMDTYDIPR